MPRSNIDLGSGGGNNRSSLWSGLSTRAAAGVLAALISTLFLAPSHAGTEIGVAEKIVRNVYGDSLNQRMKVGERLIANQRVLTGSESAAGLAFLDDIRLAIGAGSEVKLDQFVYDPERKLAKGTLNVVKGLLRFASTKRAVDVRVKTPTAIIGVRGTVFDVLAGRRMTEVAVHQGSVEVTSELGTRLLRAGEVLVIRVGTPPNPSSTPSPELRGAVAKMVALLPDSRYMISPRAEPTEVSKTSQPWLPTLAGRDLENLLLLELTYGPVLIEMRPDLAPEHVRRLKSLARAGFYDGLEFHNVDRNFVAETGEASAPGAGATIAAEFTETSFQRGSVGMMHHRGKPDSAENQFFILYRPAPHLDGRYTYWGDVVYGMQFVEQLRPGSPPTRPDRIVRLRVVSDLVK